MQVGGEGTGGMKMGMEGGGGGGTPGGGGGIGVGTELYKRIVS